MRNMLLSLLLALAPLAGLASPITVSGGSLVEDGKPVSLSGQVAAPDKALALAKAGGVLLLSLDSLAPAGEMAEEAWAQADAVLDAASISGAKVILSLASAEAKGSIPAAVRAMGGRSLGFYFVDGRLRSAYLARLKAAARRRNSINDRVWGHDSAVAVWLLADGLADPDQPSGERAMGWASDALEALRPLAPRALIGLGWKGGGEPAFLKLASLDLAYAPGEVAADLADASGKPVLSALPDGRFSLVQAPPGPAIKDLSLKLTGKDSAVLSFNCGEPCKAWVDYGSAGLLKDRQDASGGWGTRVSIPLKGLKTGATLKALARARNHDGRVSASALQSLDVPALAPHRARPTVMSSNIITAHDARFWDGDKPFRFNGANNYFIRYDGEEKRKDVLDTAQSLGMRVLRLQANSEYFDKGPLTSEYDLLRQMVVGGPTGFNEKAFAAYDRVVAECEERGIRVIIYVTDNWEYMGGARVWARWRGHESKDDFFHDPKVQEDYRGLWDHWLGRRNTVSGKLYKDDPTVFSWELMNEPECKDDTSSKTLAAWIDASAAYIKSKDPKHMVSAGLEGFLAEGGIHYSGADFTLCQKGKDIDFACFHLYPYNEYRRWNAPTVRRVIKNYVAMAHQGLRKPLVMEEFGVDAAYGRDLDRFAYTRNMAESFFEEGGDGAAVWMLTDAGSGDSLAVNRSMPEWCDFFATLSDKVNP